jgi:branched-chain amino acid transport system substrate-binding protein
MAELCIAIGAPLSGMSAGLGREMKQAAELAVQEFNDAGGIRGRRLVVAAEDDRSEVPAGEAIAHGWAARPEILGVIGHYNSDVTIAASAIYAGRGLAMITPIASNPAVTDRGLPSVLRFTNRDDRTAAAIARHLVQQLDRRRAVVVATETMYGQSMAESFTRASAELGCAVLARHTISEGQRDFGALVRGLPPRLDLIFYGGSFEGAYILRALREAGRPELFAAGDGCWDRDGFLLPAGEAAMSGEGVLVLSASPQIGRVPGSTEFAARYQRRHGPIGNYAVNSYEATRVLIAAIELAPTLTRADVTVALRALTLPGIAYHRPTAWDDKGDNTAAITALNVVTRDGYRQVAEA